MHWADSALTLSFPWMKKECVNMDVESLSFTNQQVEAAIHALDQHSLVSITDLDGTITYVNEKFSEISGYSASELLGKKHNILNSGLHSKAFWQKMHETVLSGQVWHNKVRNRAKSGDYYWVDTTIVPNFNEKNKVIGFTSIRTDITQQKRNIEQLAIAKQQAEAAKFALDQHSLVSITELDGNIIYVNDKFVQVSGYSEQELLGKRHNILNSGLHSKSFWKNMHDTVLQGEVWREEVRNRAKNGEYYWVDTTVVANYGADKEVIGFTSIRTDITQQKQNIEQLAVAKQQAEQAQQAKADFLANMSHEIRTPMNGVHASLQLLRNSNLTPEDRKLINGALFSSQNLLTIINDILDFSKVEAGMLEIENIEFNINSVIESVVSDVLPTAETKGIQFTYALEHGASDYWLGDPVRIKQILLNLVSNSIKFTAQGEVYIEVRPTIENKLVKGIYFVVKDTGIGMSSEAVSRIFERFSQADTSTTRKYGGTGLGMAITLSLIELMEGNIDVTSELGTGTEITVKLPLANISKPQAEQPKHELHCPDMSGYTILVTDDNAINRVIFDRILSATNATIIEAKNGEEAIESALCNKPDIVFMDIQMPVMDGVTAFRVLRKKEFSQPIIAFTANVLEQDIEHYTQLGFNGCVSKPIEIEQVYCLLAELKAQTMKFGQSSTDTEASLV